MSRPLDIRVRQAIVKSYASGLTYAEISTQLGVGEASVSRILRLHREKESVAPLPRGGGNFSPIQGEVAELFLKIVERLPDATLDELTEALTKTTPVTTSRAAVLRALQRLGYSRKKRPSPPSSATRPSAKPTGARTAHG